MQFAAWREGASSLKQKLRSDKSVEVVKNCGKLLSEHIWPVLCLTIMNSAARFALCWTLYKTVAAGKMVKRPIVNLFNSNNLGCFP